MDKELFETYPIYGVYQGLGLYNQPLFNDMTSFIETQIKQETGLKNVIKDVNQTNEVNKNIQAIQQMTNLQSTGNRVGSGVGGLFSVKKKRGSKWT